MAASQTRVAVAGVSGYTGGELVRLLLEHPDVELSFLGARGGEERSLSEVQPHLAGSTDLPLREIDAAAIAGSAEVVFLSLPHGVSSGLVLGLLEAGLRVIDLAGDFRLRADDYPEWYGFDHPAPALLAEAAYGLPELFAPEIAAARLVANPGCYPTAVVLPLAPLLKAELVRSGPIMVDGKSGLSGAGRSLTDPMMFATSSESVRPYRFPKHQHTPEMERGLALAIGTDAPAVSFVPHLVPAVRGVLCTSYVPLASGSTTTRELTECVAAAYAGAPFVRVLDAREMSDTKRVRGANTIEIQAVADPRTGSAIVVGALDNLVKGAAGQAIQNMNLMLGSDQAAGLSAAGVYP
jgi:N-acetyl-gamma-glutamyl-phosphate reductase